MEDSKIIELFYERSEQAIVELSKKYGDTCHKIALNILKNRCKQFKILSSVSIELFKRVSSSLIFIFNKALCFERRNWEYVWLNDLKSIIFSKWRCILNGKELLEEADIYIRENLLIEVRIK